MRKIKKLFIGLGIILLVFVSGIAYFLYSKEAPITQGEISFHIKYHGDLGLDLYEPTQSVHELRPVLVYFHGGAWIAGAKEAINNNRYHGAINHLREAGYVVISPDYTLAEQGKSPFPACIEDALGVMSWIETHAEEYKFDLNNVGIMGESAGAHVGMMASYANTGHFLATPYTFTPKYVIDVYGPTDLKALYLGSELRTTLAARLEKYPESIKEGLDIARYLFGFDPETDSVRADTFARVHSPVNYVTSDSPPLLMIHGIADRIVPLQQSDLLQETYERLKLPYEFHQLENTDHAFRGASEEQKQQVQKWVIDFIEKYYE